MRVLVTGGAGFIGSHVVDTLLNQRYEVVVVDDLSTGRKSNLNPVVPLYEIDIRSESVGAVFEEVRPQAVIHLASQVSVSSSVRDPIRDADINIRGTVKLLELCQEYGVDRLVYSSTGGALYGEPTQLPCPETYQISPLSPYGASKYAAEGHIELFGRLYEQEYAILRFANVYGPRQDPNGEAGVVAIFAKRMINGEKVVIFGDGSQERDFIYVGDIAKATVEALDCGTGFASNLGSGVGTSVQELFNRLRDVIGYIGKPEYLDERPGDVFKIYLDTSRARKKLKWAPEVSLEEGLLLTVASLREQNVE